jgi:hypothetical protein
MRTYWGSAVIAPHIIVLDTRGEWLTPRPGRLTPSTHWRGLGGPQSQSGHGDKEKMSLTLTGIEPWLPSL